MSTAERIAWGLLSLTVLIAWLRWHYTPQDEKRVGPPQRERTPRWLTIIKRGTSPVLKCTRANRHLDLGFEVHLVAHNVTSSCLRRRLIS
jgi:hypothetical protein